MQAALANSSRVTNTAFLTLKRRSSSPELRVQDDNLDIDIPRLSPSRGTSPANIPVQDDGLDVYTPIVSRGTSPATGSNVDHHDRPTSPSSAGPVTPVSSSRPTSVARTRSKRAAKSVAKFQDGAVIGKRPKAADYDDVVVALLVRAMFDYEGLVSKHNAFPDVSLRRQWTLRCWKQALKDADEWIEISERMITLVCKLSLHSLPYLH